MWTTNRVIADAEAIRTHLQKRHWRMPRSSVIAYGATIVSHAPEESHLKDWDVLPQKYYLVVCRLEPENHVREIIDGFVASNSPHTLLIFGDQKTGTPYVNELLEIIDDRIKFAGTVFNREKLQSIRWHCRAYLHGHSVGGTNPSLLEALGCGNLVIAHDNPFNREVADTVALYFRSADEIPAIVADTDALESFEESRRISQQRVTQHYTWDKVIRQYATLLDR